MLSANFWGWISDCPSHKELDLGISQKFTGRKHRDFWQNRPSCVTVMQSMSLKCTYQTVWKKRQLDRQAWAFASHLLQDLRVRRICLTLLNGKVKLLVLFVHVWPACIYDHISFGFCWVSKAQYNKAWCARCCNCMILDSLSSAASYKHTAPFVLPSSLRTGTHCRAFCFFKSSFFCRYYRQNEKESARKV